MPDLLETLRTTFGYPAFRPHQREIIEASLAGRDVFAVLPTGAGKSLCYQVPALMRPGLTLVVSPLIALMKDQVDALTNLGVSATFLNSSLGASEIRERMRMLHDGRFRLLYAAPERLMMEDWGENLRAWGVDAIAIDEAHCVSEWGHDFRPEYRQLGRLRALLPEVPMMALTATATERVRRDIVEQLKLREPATFAASFNRPNLQYRVLAKQQATQQVVEFVESRPGDSGIVYCATRSSTERLAESLVAKGIAARAYHAGLDQADRAANQEAFLRDEARVVCATIAFGMGIDKPNVRWVVHHDLPKHLEGYYQETGRAGRDGLPADCLLLFHPGDVVKHTRFLDEITNEEERAHAKKQLRQMVHFAESSVCRRKALLGYFGEVFEPESCEACDNCLEPRAMYDGTIPAQKLLSCVYRIRQASPFGVGLNHVVEVLRGADTEKVRAWQHDKLSTYGIGNELSKTEWAAVGRELVRLGLLEQEGGKFPTLALTEEGVEALRSRRRINLTKSVVAPRVEEPVARPPRAGAIECDTGLFERLRALRRQLASDRGVPPYIIFGDVTLRQMAREYPGTLEEMSRISGVGERKLRDFGNLFLEEIAGYLRENERKTFGPG